MHAVDRVLRLDELLIESAGDLIQAPFVGQIQACCANEAYAFGQGMD